MSRIPTTAMLAAIGLAISGTLDPAEAQFTDRVAVIVKISIDPSIGGTAIGATSGAIGGTPVSIDETSWSSTHSRGSPLFEGGVGIRAGDMAEILGLFNYGRAGASDDAETIGTIGGTPLIASFDDYEFWGLEGGVRFRRGSGVGPYAMLTGGFRKIKEIEARLTANGTVRGVTGYEESKVPTFAVGGGMLWGHTGFAMGFEVAVRYAGAPALRAERSVTPASGAGSRWSLPVGVVLRF